MNALLLAGGKSKRFGSNKAFVEIDGQLMIEVILEKLITVFDRTYIISDSKEEYTYLENKYQGEVEVIIDSIPGKGPLGGLYTGLLASETTYNFLTGCDLPNLSLSFIRFLCEHEKNYDVLVPEYNGYLEPLVAIYSRNLLAIIEVLLNRDILKIKSFFSDVNLKVIREEEISEVADPAHIFYNINYKRDLKKFCKQNEGGKL